MRVMMGSCVHVKWLSVLFILIEINGFVGCQSRQHLDCHECATNHTIIRLNPTNSSTMISHENLLQQTEQETNNNDTTGRMFAGHRKRMQFALLPIMYKMGVMTTLLFGLVVLTLKGLTIGVILLIIAFGNIFSKFKSQHHSQQPIHVHLHPSDKSHGDITYPSSYGYSGHWDRNSEPFTYKPPDPRQLHRGPFLYYPTRSKIG